MGVYLFLNRPDAAASDRRLLLLGFLVLLAVLGTRAWFQLVLPDDDARSLELMAPLAASPVVIAAVLSTGLGVVAAVVTAVLAGVAAIVPARLRRRAARRSAGAAPVGRLPLRFRRCGGRIQPRPDPAAVRPSGDDRRADRLPGGRRLLGPQPPTGDRPAGLAGAGLCHRRTAHRRRRGRLQLPAGVAVRDHDADASDRAGAVAASAPAPPAGRSAGHLPPLAQCGGHVGAGGAAHRRRSAAGAGGRRTTTTSASCTGPACSSKTRPMDPIRTNSWSRATAPA